MPEELNKKNRKGKAPRPRRNVSAEPGSTAGQRGEAGRGLARARL